MKHAGATPIDVTADLTVSFDDQGEVRWSPPRKSAALVLVELRAEIHRSHERLQSLIFAAERVSARAAAGSGEDTSRAIVARLRQLGDVYKRADSHSSEEVAAQSDLQARTLAGVATEIEEEFVTARGGGR